jgi:hypothetical protein
MQSGTSLPKLMELGGWKSYEMVLRYAHLAPEKLSFVAGRIERQVSRPHRGGAVCEKRSKKRYVFATVGTLMLSNFLIEKRARTDYFGAFGPSASLRLGSPCGRSTSPDGEVVEPVLCLSAVRIVTDKRSDPTIVFRPKMSYRAHR